MVSKLYSFRRTHDFRNLAYFTNIKLWSRVEDVGKYLLRGKDVNNHGSVRYCSRWMVSIKRESVDLKLGSL